MMNNKCVNNLPVYISLGEACALGEVGDLAVVTVEGDCNHENVLLKVVL